MGELKKHCKTAIDVQYRLRLIKACANADTKTETLLTFFRVIVYKNVVFGMNHPDLYTEEPASLDVSSTFIIVYIKSKDIHAYVYFLQQNPTQTPQQQTRSSRQTHTSFKRKWNCENGAVQNVKHSRIKGNAWLVTDQGLNENDSKTMANVTLDVQSNSSVGETSAQAQSTVKNDREYHFDGLTLTNIASTLGPADHEM